MEFLSSSLKGRLFDSRESFKPREQVGADRGENLQEGGIKSTERDVNEQDRVELRTEASGGNMKQWESCPEKV